MARPYHHNVYIVELRRTVLDEPRFRRTNPDYVEGKPCVYVGMTGLSPDFRFDKPGHLGSSPHCAGRCVDACQPHALGCA